MADPAVRQSLLSADSRLLALLQLCRIPNVFTALADITMGYLVAQQGLAPFLPLLLLATASSLIYTAGMVLNDVYDVDRDAQLRPHRPIPSGRVPLQMATSIGWTFLLVGVALAWVVSRFVGDLRPGVIATVLGVSVWCYDSRLKELLMGACRALNVLLGMSVMSQAWSSGHVLIALGIGVYVAGLTWFARTEAEQSRRPMLVGATLTMLLGMGLLACFPQNFLTPSGEPLATRSWLWLVLVAAILYRALPAIRDPSPRHVQGVVKQYILGLIVLDAAVVWVVLGRQGLPIGSWGELPWALLMLLWLVPALWLGRIVYST